MAYGSELYLGLVGEHPVLNTLRSLGLEYDPDNGIFEKYALLEKAQREAFEEMGMKIIDPAKIKKSNGRKLDTGYLYIEGLDGKIRQTSIWALEVDYDPHEMGHTKDDMLIGVSLISRYFPVFLDWPKDSGGSGDTISLTPDILENIEIARKHLSKVLPFIQDAPIVFRERHY
jgi:hypothetical protein